MKHLHQLKALAIALILCSNSCSLSKDNDKRQWEPEQKLEVWIHSRAGAESDSQVIKQQIKDFNSSQRHLKVELTIIPERSYSAQIQTAALSQTLPDMIEFDGPWTAYYAWQGNLIPLENLISKGVVDDLLPSIVQQGTYKNHLYSVGTFDAGLCLYGHRSQLNAAGVRRLPKGYKDAWTIAEFNQVLTDLAKKDVDGQVLDLQLNGREEWITFGYAPIIVSAGADLIRRSDYKSANGKLNSPEAVRAMKQVQSWIKEGYVDENNDGAAFSSGRVALSWVGHWAYRNYKSAAVKDDLVVLPLPNFGKGSKSSQGSFSWGITTSCKEKACQKAAAKFLEFLLQPKQVLATANASDAIPGTKSAIAQSKFHGKEGPLHLFADQLMAKQYASRPQSPAYPVITLAFQEAFTNISKGYDARETLDNAVKEIDLDLENNQGYPDAQRVVLP